MTRYLPDNFLTHTQRLLKDRQNDNIHFSKSKKSLHELLLEDSTFALRKMKLSTHYSINLKLALPVMIGQLGHILVGVGDSIMVGQLGTVPLAAAALGNSLFGIFMVFGIGVTFGITPLIAQADGRRNKHLQALVLHHGFWVNLLVSFLLFISIVAMGPLLPFLKQDADVVNLTLPYLNIISVSVVPLIMFMTFKQFAEGLSDTRMAMFIIVGCNLVNIGLNYLLIYGNWGFPELGLNGAGWATLVARVLMVITMWIYVYKSRKFAALNLTVFHRNFRRRIVGKLLSLGIPSGLQYIFEVSAFSMAAIFAGMISATALAAHHIAINIASVSYMAVTGIGAAATVRVGNQMGRKDPDTLKQAANSIFVMGLVWMAAAGAVIYLFRAQLAGFYSQDPAVLLLAGQMLIVVVLFQISDGLQAVALGALRGFQDVKIPTTITFVAYWVLTMPVAYVLSQHTPVGVMGIWYALAGGLSLSAALLVVRFYRLWSQFRAGLQT